MVGAQYFTEAKHRFAEESRRFFGLTECSERAGEINLSLECLRMSRPQDLTHTRESPLQDLLSLVGSPSTGERGADEAVGDEGEEMVLTQGLGHGGTSWPCDIQRRRMASFEMEQLGEVVAVHQG